MPAARPLLARFWEKVDKGEGPGCWVWTGSTTHNGYGEIHVEGSARRAHRVSWEMHYGEIPEGMQVLHTCDNRPCVRPKHLFLGTGMDNTRDMQKKGRAPRGEAQSSARLAEGQVTEIRRRYAAGGETYQSLADEFGVALSTVSDAVRGRTWAHLLA